MMKNIENSRFGMMGIGIWLVLLCGWFGSAWAGTVSVSIPSSADTRISSYYATWNFGGSGGAYVGNVASSDSGDVNRGLIRFDVSSIPSNARILSATMRLAFNQRTTTVTSLSVYRVRRTWLEGTKNYAVPDVGATWHKPVATQSDSWTTYGALDDTVQPASTTTTSDFRGSNTSEVRFNFTNLEVDVQYWVQHPTWNHGWLIVNGDEVNGRHTTNPDKLFYTKETTVSNTEPYLDIEYEIPARSVFLSVTPDMDTALDSYYKDSNTGNSGIMYIGNTSSSPGGEIYRGLIHFDLSLIPAGSKVLSATMWSAYSQASDRFGTVLVHRVTSAWTEGTGGLPATATNGATWNKSDAELSVSWSTVGGDYVATASSMAIGKLKGSGACRFDYPFNNLTNDVLSWINAPQSNYGWLIRNNDEVNGRNTTPWTDKAIWTRENDRSFDATTYLDILYQAPPKGTMIIVR